MVEFLSEMAKWRAEVDAGTSSLTLPQWMCDLIEREHGHRFAGFDDVPIIEFGTPLESIALKHALDKSAELS
jgi:hypothetical protein